MAPVQAAIRNESNSVVLVFMAQVPSVAERRQSKTNCPQLETRPETCLHQAQDMNSTHVRAQGLNPHF